MDFFISDCHFFHANIIKHTNRPFDDELEMNEVLIRNWNNKVDRSDNVYVLGDFSFGNAQKTIKIMNRLNGNIHLVKGNHDQVITKNAQLRGMFGWVKDYYLLRVRDLKIVLFHYPIQSWDGKYHNSIHLYGHVHNSEDNQNSEPNSYNVGVDVNDYAPVSLDEILEKLNRNIKEELI